MATAVSYRVVIDTNGDGDFSDLNEVQPVLEAGGVAIAAGRDQPRQYSPVRVGNAAWTSDNRDNRYTSGTSATGLGTLVTPNCRCKVQAVYGTATTTLISGFEGVYGNSTDHVRTGTGSALLAGSANSTGGWDATDTAADYSGKLSTDYWAAWVYVQNAPNIDTLKVKFRTGPLVGDMFVFTIPGSPLVNGWNRISAQKSAGVAALSPSWASIGRVDVELNTNALGAAATWWDSLEWGSGGELPLTYIDLFTGIIDHWQVKIPQYPLIVADFQALDALAQLAATTVYSQLYSGITTDQAVGYTLDAAGYTGDRTLATGYTSLGYFWLDGQSALDALNALADHESGAIYVDGYGAFTFENRYTRQSQSVDLATFTDTTIQGIGYRTAVRDVVNRVEVTCAPRAIAGSLSAVWSAPATVVLAPYEARAITAHGSDPFSGALVPVSGTDFAVSAGSVASVSALDRTSGQTASFTITAGSDGATLTGLQLRAFTLTKLLQATWIAEDVASQAAYGLRGLSFDLPWLADANVGRDAAYYYLGRYSQPVDVLDVTLRAGTTDSTNAATQQVLNRALGQRVRVTLASLAIDWSGFIQSVKHKLRYGLHEATYSVERTPAQAVFTLDTDVLDGNATLGW